MKNSFLSPSKNGAWSNDTMATCGILEVAYACESVKVYTIAQVMIDQINTLNSLLKAMSYFICYPFKFYLF